MPSEAMRHLLFPVLLAPLCLHAADWKAPPVPADTSVFSEQNPKNGFPNEIKIHPIQTELPETPTVIQNTRENIPLLETLITHAALNKNAKELQELLDFYRTIPDTDPILIDYAQGVLLHIQGNRAAAIESHRKLSERYPDMKHIRMNLATMQLEDKRYGDARQQLQLLAQSEDHDIRNFSNILLKQIDRTTKWKYDGYLEYDHNRNVNNASEQDYIEINGKRLAKSQNSMPKQAEGFRYGFSASKLFPLKGNHALSAGSSIGGKYYWDNHDYDQHNLYLSGSYIYQNRDWSFRTTPSISQSWLGGSRYNRSTGISQSVSRQLTPNWRMQLSGSVRKTRYSKEDYRDFDNTTFSVSPILAYSDKRYSIYGGIGFSRNHAEKESLSSDTARAYAGFSKVLGDTWQLAGNVSFSREHYDRAPELRITPYPFRRKDKTVNADLSLWRTTWQYKGFAPKLNVSYFRILSNMPAFYSRENRRAYISIEKMF